MDRRRISLTVYLMVAAVWQIYLIVSAFRDAPVLRAVLAGLGGEASPVSRSFLGLYLFWPLVPIASSLLALAALRRERDHPSSIAAALILSFGAGLVLHVWLHLAFFRPLSQAVGALR